jgi:hypothetical protein
MTGSRDSETVALDALSTWCEVHLGPGVDALLFEAGFATRVIGLRLRDRREVVLKVRPHTPRLRGAAAVHACLWNAGFPCPRPLVALEPFESMWISAESLVRGGDVLADELDAPELYAAALAALVTRAPATEQVPALEPPPAWLHWDHAETWHLATLGSRACGPQCAAVALIATGCRAAGACATARVLGPVRCRSRRLVVSKPALDGPAAACRVRLGQCYGAAGADHRRRSRLPVRGDDRRDRGQRAGGNRFSERALSARLPECAWQGLDWPAVAGRLERQHLGDVLSGATVGG